MTHPDSLVRRVKLNNEWHARPVADMTAPFRCTHQVFYRDSAAGNTRKKFAEFCDRFSQPRPGDESRHHVVQIGSALIKWEGHTDADSVTHLVPGNATPLFSESANRFAPSELEGLFGADIICGVQIEVLKGPRDSMDMDNIRAALGTTAIYGGPVADGNASLWSSFNLDPEGYSRLVIVDHSLPLTATGRLLQRVVESESYRLQAMGALPLARKTMASLSALEDELEPLMDQLSQADENTNNEVLLTRLSTMAAKIEHLAAASSYRFAAARAYSSIVEQRLRELREDRVLTQPRYSVFLLRSLQPAMRTCEAAERRIDELAQRVSRAITLLNSMVEMIQTRQTNTMIEAMSRNAAIQVRLQQAVEGFSTFVISYYAIGLLGYMLVGARSAGLLPFDPKIIVGISAPIVLLVVWGITRWVRKRLTREFD